MRKRLIKTVTAAVILTAAGILYYFTVTLTGFAVPCLFRKVTGLYCPGCGVTGVLAHMLRFDFEGAFACNQALFVSLPFIVYIIAKMIYDYIKRGSFRLGKVDAVLTYVLIAALLCFAVIRNLPPCDFLRPYG